ncbi:hypothetical protein EK21DRAFT_111972 [Setomelanomma holmii]|uniref:Uncharacterized protein n=1 Tax=Setomelanomma holmii TaxID=210430 RepID=A0A9P4LP24_9PLEO|nr:hypothetical protein EK21DRAFT_111972 [Setomelanomma holmii]
MSSAQVYNPDLEEIIDRYSPSVPDSSPPKRATQPYDSSTQNEDVYQLEQSPPPSVPSDSLKSKAPRQGSTNSGYLCRSELYGRVSPQPSPAPSFPSRALERIEERRRAGLSTPDLRKSRSSGFLSTSDLRNVSSVSPDEWIEAGSQVYQPMGSGQKPGPALASNTGWLSEDETQTPAQSAPSNRSQMQQISHAEMALRQTLVAAAPSTHARKSSWSRWIFGRSGQPSNSRRGLRSPISDDNISVFDFVQPENVQESPEDILARIRARGAALKHQAGISDPDGGLNDLSEEFEYDSSTMKRSQPQDVSHDAGSLPSTESGSFHGSVGISTLTLNVSSPDLPESFVDRSHRLSMSLVATTFECEPIPPQVTLNLSSLITVLQTKPCAPEPHMTLSSVHTVAEYEPVEADLSRGLSFSVANAIIYGMMAVAALRFIILNLGREVRTSDLTFDLGIAAAVALMLCTMIHRGLGGCVGDIRDAALQRFRAITGQVYGSHQAGN